MIPYWANKDVYKYFDNFLTQSVLENDSYLTDEENILTLENFNLCVSAFVDNPDANNRSFDEKAHDQFKDSNEQVKLVFAHCIWLWGVAASDMTKSGKKSSVTRFLEKSASENLKDVFLEGGIGSAGQWHKQNKPFEISYALLLLQYVKQYLVPQSENDLEKLKTLIEKLCLNLYYQLFENLKVESDRLISIVSERQIAIHHILLHLCNPNKYEPITSNNNKKRIISAFFSLLNLDKPDSLWDDIDGAIFKIRNELAELIEKPNVTFYDENVAQAWNCDDSE